MISPLSAPLSVFTNKEAIAAVSTERKPMPTNCKLRDKRKLAVSSGFLDGRGWDRTSDLPRVKRALSR
jgi:hypothetical protein